MTDAVVVRDGLWPLRASVESLQSASMASILNVGRLLECFTQLPPL